MALIAECGCVAAGMGTVRGRMAEKSFLAGYVNGNDGEVEMRIKLTIAYDGTRYVGWQVQKNGISVQQRVNEAVSDLFGTPIEVIGASRTDSGVHALANVAAFDVETRMPPEKIAYALNQRLPEDIVIQSSEQVEDEFHPRYDALEKTYEYHILGRRHPLPLKRKDCYFYHRPLDADRMRSAAGYLVGEHDFSSFCSAHAQTNTFVRTIYSLSVRTEGEEIILRVTGSGFLYNMVRIIAGTLIEIGAGLREPEELGEILAARDRSKAGPTAPAKGLTLVEIVY